MYCHRGAYLDALGDVLHSGFTHDSVYLWTLPMFHCNGWCTAWALVAVGGTQVCLREVRGDAIWQLIDGEGVTHLNGAPTVVATVLDAPQAHVLDHPIVITTAAAPPSPTALARAERMGFSIVHVYGLTETYGPYAVCQWQHQWDGLDPQQRARLRARQGVGMIQTERMRVVETALRDGRLVDVPADGVTMGEIVMRGNNVMKGYYRDPDATARAFAGGWFHSGDLGVMHPDGYVELRDRAKDIVISGGENIPTIEVEQTVLAYAAVLDAAVIGVPDEKWGERPKAFVVLKPGSIATEAELLDHVRARIAQLQGPTGGRVRRRAADDLDRQAPEVRLTGEGVDRPDLAHQGLSRRGRAELPANAPVPTDLLRLDGVVVDRRRRVDPPRPAPRVVRELREQQVPVM